MQLQSYQILLHKLEPRFYKEVTKEELFDIDNTSGNADVALLHWLRDH